MQREDTLAKSESKLIEIISNICGVYKLPPTWYKRWHIAIAYKSLLRKLEGRTMKLYIYERNQEGEKPFYTFAEAHRLSDEECAKDEDGTSFKLLGIAESDHDVCHILDESGYAGEYAGFFMRDLCAVYGRVDW